MRATLKRTFAKQLGRTCRVAFGSAAWFGLLWFGCVSIPEYSLGGLPDTGVSPRDALTEDRFVTPDVGDGDAFAEDAGPLRVFATSIAIAGTFGLANNNPHEEADNACQGAASQAPGLSGRTWFAFLWSSDPAKGNPLTRIRKRGDGWHRVEPGGGAGLLIAASFADVDRTPIAITNAFGQSPFSSTDLAWTGGSGAMSLHCNDWKVADAGGIVGLLLGSPSQWLSNSVLSCDKSAYLYCFEQP